jgi:RNA polymerase sigma-70 factor (ECF subfamily)
VIATELIADRRYERAYQRRTIYNKAHYSLDAEDGIEASAIACHTDNPEDVFAIIDNHCRLCCALNTLPETQGRRVETRYLLGRSIQEIAYIEGVSESAVKKSIDSGLKAMKNIF